MNHKIVRLLQNFFGASLLVFGFNGFFHFLPLPEKEGFAKVFLTTLQQAGYLFPTIACIQIFAGITLLSNRWVAGGMLALLPVSFNIAAFHLLHDRESLVLAIILLVLNISFIRWIFIQTIFNRG